MPTSIIKCNCSHIWPCCYQHRFASLMVQSKKRGLSIDEKKQVVLQMLHESKDIYMLKARLYLHVRRSPATAYLCLC